MFKALLFDIDGVLINRGEYYSQRYAREAGVPLENIEPFFKTEFPSMVIGKADLKLEIKPYLKSWKWKGSAQEFLDEWFETESELNQELLDKVQEYRNQGIICCIQSNQEKHRAEYIIKQLKLNDYFDRTFFSCNLGLAKPDPRFFEHIWGIISKRYKLTNKHEILFIDDEEKNIKAAKQFGMSTHRFINNAAFMESIQNE